MWKPWPINWTNYSIEMVVFRVYVSLPEGKNCCVRCLGHTVRAIPRVLLSLLSFGIHDLQTCKIKEPLESVELKFAHQKLVVQPATITTWNWQSGTTCQFGLSETGWWIIIFLFRKIPVDFDNHHHISLWAELQPIIFIIHTYNYI